MAHDRQKNVSQRKRGRPKTNRGNADRISALPDSVLSHILSYIPTKNVVATSVIAKRWRNVWTAVPNLSFDDRLCLRPPRSTYVPLRGFAEFVHTVLLRTYPAKIAKFSLYCSRPTNLSRFYHWIATALMREVGEIQLYLGQQSRVELPEAIYSAACLQVLTLDSDFSIQLPSSGTCFPSVKILRLRLENPEKSVTENLFCSCPSLEELSVTCDLEDDAPPPNFIISSATLKSCKFSVRSEDMLFREVDYMLTITAPKLECLEIYSDILGSFVMHDLHSPKKVILEIMHAEWAQVDPYRAIQLLAGINSCTYLHLCSGIMSVSNHNYNCSSPSICVQASSKHGCTSDSAITTQNSPDFSSTAVDHACDSCFPSFPQLNHIEMGVGPIGWRVLPIVLRSSPNLESLVLHKECWFQFTEEQFGWLESESVPHCLVHTVKNIEIKGVQGDDDERPLLQYFLKFAAAMETMLMWAKGTVPIENRANLRDSILQFQRASMMATIAIK